MEAAQAERTPDFLEHLHEPGFLQQFMSSRLGSTTHVERARRRRLGVRGHDGTNGEGSGLVVPGTGIHVDNMMGEQDLSPAAGSRTRRDAGCPR